MKTVTQIVTKLSNHTFMYDKANFTEIYFDDLLFSNAAELVCFDNNFSLQPQICEQCGVSGCNQDGYYKIRKLGNNAIFIPDIDQPFIILNDEQFELLRTRIKTLPSLATIPDATAKEMAHSYLSSAPKSLLTYTDRILLNKEFVITTNTHNDEEIYNILGSELNQMINDDNKVTLCLTEQVPITLFLESFSEAEWHPLVKIDNQYFIYLGSGYYIKHHSK